MLYRYQVWGISETRDQNYHSNAGPSLRLADLLTAIEIRLLVYHFGPFPLVRSIFFSDAFGPRSEKLNGKQTQFSGKNHQIEPSSDRNLNFFLTIFTSILSLICG